MSYEVRVDHPESDQRQAEDWTSWNFWSKEHAPWAGINVDQQARILDAVCPRDITGDICEALDTGGTLTAPQARLVAQTAGPAMPDQVRAVFEKAVADGYGVRVVFKRGAFGAPSASEYRAKELSV